MPVTREQALEQYRALLPQDVQYRDDVESNFNSLWGHSDELWEGSAPYDASNPTERQGYDDESQRSPWSDLLAAEMRPGGNTYDRFYAEDAGGGDDPDGDGTGGGGTQYPRDGGAAVSQQQLSELLAAIEAMNNQPDVDLSGIEPGDFPSFEVPGEDLSPAIDDTLLDLMTENYDPLGLKEVYKGLLDRTAGGGVNSERLQLRNENARSQLIRGQQAALEDLRGVLADRGLIGVSGAPEGAELDSTVRAFEPLQRIYLENLRESQAHESELADNAEVQALQIATGWTQDQVERRLGAARTGQERQQMMADISLGVLDRNIAWNKFLAEFGLEREKVAADIRQGKINAIAPVINMFLALTAQSRGGYIGQ